MTPRRTLPPLDAAALERLAIRYVERYATSRGKLATYLRRKVRERGYAGGEAAIDPLVERMAELRYVDDADFAASRAAALTRRGLGRRRVEGALREAGIEGADADAALQASAREARTAILAYARRRKIGPFAAVGADRALLNKHIAALVRAGHDFALAREIASLPPGAEPDVEECVSDA